MPDDFYKDKAWDLLMQRLADIAKLQEEQAEAQKEQAKDVAYIKERMAYVYGIVAAVSLIATVGWSFVRDKFINK